MVWWRAIHRPSVENRMSSINIGGAEGFLNNIAPQEKKTTLTPLANSEGKKISSGGGGFDMSFGRQERTRTMVGSIQYM